MAFLTSNRKKIALATASILVAGAAQAGSDTTFDAINTMLSDWATGSLGKVISMTMFILGIGAGIVKQSIMAVAAGVGAALVLAYGPGVIDTMFTAII